MRESCESSHNCNASKTRKENEPGSGSEASKSTTEVNNVQETVATGLSAFGVTPQSLIGVRLESFR